MEGEEMEMVMGGSSSSSGSGSGSGMSTRWNPTKEQINMLENLYKQGIRTPTAEEIQQITARLSVYGHIEGKNVFYWFQNHKARQRQKHKQESIAYFNRFLHHRPNPLFTPHLSPNVMCAPYCMPQTESSEIGFYPQYHHNHQHPKVLVPIRRNTNPNSEKIIVPMGMMMMPTRTTTTTMCTTNNAPVSSVAYEAMMMQMQQQQGIISDCNNNNNLIRYSNQETLDLFPLHPTGILEAAGKATDSNNNNNNNNEVVVSSSLASSSVSATHHSSTDHNFSASADHGYGNQNQQQQPFFDFFTSGQGPLESG